MEIKSFDEKEYFKDMLLRQVYNLFPGQTLKITRNIRQKGNCFTETIATKVTCDELKFNHFMESMFK